MSGHTVEKKEHKVVISGIAGRFPNSNNVSELQQNLLNKVDCTTTEHGRWDYDSEKIPQCIGKCNNINKFDRVFFGVHNKLTALMDPCSRLLLEHSFEAILDAGINPRSLKGANIAVYTATNISESEKTIFNHTVQKDGFGIMGGSKAMTPNRVSFFLGLTGSSINLDSGCAGSASALERAYYDIKNGLCEGAIVAGCILCIHAHISYQLKMLGQLSEDGKTRSFDDAANGHTRSDTIAVLFLQRASDAKRIYQEVVHVKQGCYPVEEVNSIMYPKAEAQIEIMKGALEESGLTPDDISFLEASGVGIKQYDIEELKAIDAVYGKRKVPIPIGAVSSYIGNAIPANSINSIVKMIVGSETGMIPPTLHYETPNSKAACLKEGRVKVPTELTPWTGEYSTVHTIATGGVVSNIILKAPNIKKKNNGVPTDNLQRLVIASGRTEEAVSSILSYMESRPLDAELLQMMYDIFQSDIDGYLYRGYSLIPAQGLVPDDAKKREILFHTGEKRQIWWIFSGMGSQWVGMGEALLKLPVFDAAIKKCDNVLKPLGYDIYKIIRDKDPATFDNILNAFIGIAAIQIGLVDVLKAVELEPDFIIGHSVGELGCAYADGCFTAEQMILAALSRGLASIETELIEGSMAAVGLGYDDIKPLCPPDIDVACHNGPESSTISGPAESMKQFVTSLTEKGIFAKEVPCGRIAYHSRYIASAGTTLMERLQKIVPKPNPRSPKWVSSSVPRSEWNTLKARLSSAEYHTNNLLNPVLFDETSRLIPANAICVEIAPHGLLQAILKRSLPKGCINIPLTRRGHPDNLEFLLTALGKMYNVGLHPQVANLYPKVEYPVGRGTPSLSSLIKWDHSTDWNINYYVPMDKIQDGEQSFEIDLKDEAFKHFRGNIVNGKIAIPLSFCLVKAWEIVKCFDKETMSSVIFENIQVHKLIVNVPEDEKITLTVMIPKGTGIFEIVETETLLLSGNIRTTKTPDKEKLSISKRNESKEKAYQLDENDFYTEMEMRGFQYSDEFRTVSQASIDGSEALLKWNDDWIIYIDGALQFYIFSHDSRQVELPLSIRKIVIDHFQHDLAIKKKEGIEVFVDKTMDCVSAGGLEMQGLKLSVIPKSPEPNRLSADTEVLVPNINESTISLATSLRLILQLVVENFFVQKMPVVQVLKQRDSGTNRNISRVICDVPEATLFKIDYDIAYEDATFNKALTVLEDEIYGYDMTEIAEKLGKNKFVLSFTSFPQPKTVVELMYSNGLKVVFMRRVNNEYVILFRKKQTHIKFHTVEVSGNIAEVTSKISNIKSLSEHERVVLVIRRGVDVHMNDLKLSLQNSPNFNKIRMFDFRNSNVSDSSLVELLNEQIESDIFVNILTASNCWATLRQVGITLKPKLFKSWKANQKYLHDPTVFTWTEAPSISNSATAVKVEYSSLNPQDILIAKGSFDANLSATTRKSRIEEIGIGVEFSGIDSNENRVMGITLGNAMANYVKSDQDWIWNVPESWSLEDAATVPLSYIVAYSACVLKAEIEAGEKVLIAQPSSEFGLAAVNLALQKKCNVFVTYESEEERKLVRSLFPTIKEEHILELSISGFQKSLVLARNGQGMDAIIYNGCGIDEIKLFSTILKRRSRLVFISDLNDNHVHKSIGMEMFLEEVKFYPVIPTKVLHYNSKTKKLLANMLNDGINTGYVKPLPRTIFLRESLNEAFTAVSENKYQGKIVVKTQPEESNTNEALAIPRLSPSESNSYIILEGLTHFGLELIDWLVTRGARKFIVASTSKVDSGYANLRMKYWKDYGVKINLRQEFNYSVRKNIKALFDEAKSLGQLDGLFDLRQMSTMNKSSFDSFDATTLAVDEESRCSGAELRFFVVFSATNKASVNSTDSTNQKIEKVLKKRKEDGLDGLLIKWKFVNNTQKNGIAYKTNVVTLPIPKYIQKLDEVLGSEESIVEVSYFTPTIKDVEEDVIESNTYTLDPEIEEHEAFKANLYKGHGVHVDFYSLQLEI